MYAQEKLICELVPPVSTATEEFAFIDGKINEIAPKYARIISASTSSFTENSKERI